MSQMTSETMRDLENNEIEFFSLHRSEKRETAFAALLISPIKEVALWNFAGAIRCKPTDTDTLITDTKAFFAQKGIPSCFRITPMTEPLELEASLQTEGFKPVQHFSTMVFAKPIETFSTPDDVVVRTAKTEEDINLFTRLQIEGFNSPWALLGEWFLETNRRNYLRKDHVYYIATLDVQPVGVSLLLSSANGIGGIYAVATLESARGRGVATALMQRAVHDSQTLGNSMTCLGTETGKYPERFFGKVGFETAFVSKFYRA